MNKHLPKFIAAALTTLAVFYRKPQRLSNIEDRTLFLSPADGQIVAIEPIFENEYFHDYRLQVSIFLSPIDVHYQWCSVFGNVILVEHQDGNHNHARLPKSSSENERSLVIIETENHIVIAIRQIAGALARRVVTYLHPGQYVTPNTFLGLIKLGSRVDMYLPIDTELYVKNGDIVRGNISVLGKLKS